MKYLYQESCDDLNQDDVRQAENAFRERCDAYDAAFAAVAPALPKRFVKEYQRYYFHDYRLEELTIAPGKNGVTLTLTLSNYENEILRIEYCQVRSVRMQLDHRRFTQVMAAELLPTQGKQIAQEFSFWGPNLEPEHSLSFTFSGMRFKKTKRP